MAEILAGQTVGHFLLLEKLGAGGLGEVWKARDQTLGRVVALKFVHGEARELLREARAASALNHPNIVTVFEVGEGPAGPFMAMELVEGRTLRARMNRDPVSRDEALEIARQAATGLAAAHAAGIIHRDLKPENIMIRPDGYVKLLDFGLAKRLPWAHLPEGSLTATAGTATGQLAGTFNYMSPEQARGLEVAAPSDVFSFGIVLYEMLTAVHPFRGPTVMDTLQNIIARDPPENAALPSHLRDAVWQALRKDPAERFANAGALSAALAGAPAPATSPRPASSVIPTPRWRQVLGATLSVVLAGLAFWPDLLNSRAAAAGQLPGAKRVQAAAAARSVAVLVFRAPPQAAAVAEALSEDLSTALMRSGMQVAAQSSVASLGAEVTPLAAGQRLNVDAVFAGSIRILGPQVRIHVELVDTKNAFQIWSDTFTLARQAALAGEQSVAGEVVNRMHAALAARE